MKFSIKKELKEWGILLGIFGILYITGLHTEVAALAQRALLSTGIITPDTETIDSTFTETVNYDWTINSMDGNTIDMKQFKGKLLFINLWATWCAPCRAEMPGIQSLYEEFDHENVEFILLSVDKNPVAVKSFIEKKEFTFPVYTLNGGIPKEFESPSIPTTYIVSPDGKIIKKKVGMAKYNTNSFKKFLEKHAIPVE